MTFTDIIYKTLERIGADTLVVCIPLMLLAGVGVLGWRFRRSISRSMGNIPDGLTHAEPQVTAQAGLTVVPLAFRRLEVAEVGPTTGQAVAALTDAKATGRSTRLVYTAAGLAWIAITTFALTLGVPADLRFPAYAEFIKVYLQQLPPLFLLVWFVGTSLRARLAILGAYLLLGLLAVPIAPSFSRAAAVATLLARNMVLPPLMGLLLLLTRSLRPWLIGLSAILVIYFSLMALLWVFGVLFLGVRMDIPDSLRHYLSGVSAWSWVAGLIYPIIAVVVVGWLLRRGWWWLLITGLASLAVVAGVALSPLSPDGWLLPVMGLSSNVLQVILVWLLFKLFVRLEEAQFFPAQVLHSHLCWGFLTSWDYIFTTYVYHGWAPWAVLLAYGLYLTVLHALLRQLWAMRVDRPGKRLLLLRVFDRADQREKLLDDLDNTWRFLGRIDLIAGTDLATRTMGSRMLEAFLLRRTDEQFLKTAEEVDRRLDHLHSRLGGDARYPVNGVYCYATAWQRAVARLAPKSDAVLMDLRSFTSKNRGCVFELEWVVHHIPLSRVILLTDARTDYPALEEVAQAGWAHLPPDSPNAGLAQPVLTILNASRRTRESRDALFRLLLHAAYAVESSVVQDDRVEPTDSEATGANLAEEHTNSPGSLVKADQSSWKKAKWWGLGSHGTAKAVKGRYRCF
jgi:hypothetical protein